MRILVYGAGLIGGYIGGHLHAAGLPVTLLGRPDNAAAWSQGLDLTDYLGGHTRTTPLHCVSELGQLESHPDMILLTVKCAGLQEACADLSRHLKHPARVVCFQNGVGALEMVSSHLPRAEVYYGMVGFNVSRPRPDRLHRGTEGDIEVQNAPCLVPLLEAWTRSGVPARACADPEATAWGKLLLNLNNAVNALAGVPLLEELHNRSYRTVLANCQSELLAALRASGIRPAQLTRAPVWLLPWILRAPDWLFKLVARQMLAIDPLARSSMWEDLEARKETEIDFLNGAVVRLAQAYRVATPVNQAIIRLVREAQKAGEGSPHLSGEELSSATKMQPAVRRVQTKR